MQNFLNLWKLLLSNICLSLVKMKLELHLQSVPAKIKIDPGALGLSFGFSLETILSFSTFIRRWYLIYFFIFQLSTFVHLAILLALCVEWYEIAEVTSIISFTCSALITFPFFFLLNKGNNLCAYHIFFMCQIFSQNCANDLKSGLFSSIHFVFHFFSLNCQKQRKCL